MDEHLYIVTYDIADDKNAGGRCSKS